jgi:phage tail-like protein
MGASTRPTGGLWDMITTVQARQDGSKDPVPSYAFHVEINGIVEASFTQCSGLSVTREVTALKEGGVNDGVRWLQSGLTFGKVTLQSGIAHSEVLWNWFKEGSEDAKVTYRRVAILQMVPYTQTVVRRYDLTRCMATAWTGPSLNTGSNEAAIETIELAFERFALTRGT